MWSPPKPISDAIPPNVVRIPYWPRWKDSVVPNWPIILLKLSAVVILISLSFGAIARRVWKPGANYWLDFAWYSGLCQFVAAFALTLVSLPLYLILDDLLGVFIFVAMFGGALAGRRFARLERHHQPDHVCVEKHVLCDVAIRHEDYLDDELHHDGAVASLPESQSRGVQNNSSAIGGVAIGLLFSFALMLSSVMLGKLCWDQGLLPNHKPFLGLRITGVLLAICGVCSVLALLFRNQTDQVKGIMLGMIAGCLFWSVLMFCIH